VSEMTIKKYRIIYNKNDIPCHWQLQERKWLFFWKNLYLSFSSRKTAEREINILERK
jgi:hypothetical protein